MFGRLTSFLLALALTGTLLTNCRSRRAAFGTDEVDYSGAATAEEATALGEALVKEGMFRDMGARVHLSKDHSGALITYVVNSMRPIDNPIALWRFYRITRDVAGSVGGLPLRMRFELPGRVSSFRLSTNPWTIYPGVTVATKDEVAYSGAATEQQAQALGDALRQVSFFMDRGETVFLSKDGFGTVISFVLNDDELEKPDSGSFTRIGQLVAYSVGGPPVTVRLLNTSRMLKKSLGSGNIPP